MSPEKMVLIVGLDGATFDLILPWVENGDLPFLHEMMENGAFGELTSVIPILTPPAWSSFATGRNPGKHGVVGFFHHVRNGYDIEMTNSTHRSASEIWSILSENGRKVGVVNVPLTYPPKKVNGYMITGMMTPPDSKDFAYPVSLREQVKRVTGKSTLDPLFTYLEKEDIFVNELFDSTDRLAKISSFLIKTHRLDFFMVVFNGTDYIQHRFWGYIDPSHPKYQAQRAEKHRRIILRYYQRMDEIIADLFALTGEKATVIVMSDHGAGPLKKYIHLNSWLMHAGFLVLERNPAIRIRRFMYKAGLNPEESYNALLKFPSGNLRIRGSRADKKLRFLLKRFFLSFSDVDWKKTRAYSTGSGVIYVNLKGREPLGIVDPGSAYENLRDELIHHLCQLIDPETGEHVVEKVYRKEEIYTGHCSGIMPDLVLLPRAGYMAFEEYEFGSHSILTHAKAVSASHRLNGILLIKGPQIKKGVRLKDASIMDVAPTVLHLLGLPIPTDIDGKVLVDAVNPSYFSLNPIRYVKEKSGQPLPLKEKGSQQSQEDEEKVKTRLRRLGYL